ncbi:MAG: hypothetical protein LIO43_03195, partial [Clostridiales bacterium]|nr:hypothetical protein [Clostridiales bacterium]
MEDIMDYNQTISFLMNKQRLGIIPGLSRMKKLLEGMGNPQKNLKIIHIAGTNGKGTVANMIANALSAEGKKTGLFTSPWVVDYREQIQINSKWTPKEKLSEYVSEYQNAEATEFELITAIMYKYFYDEKVDYAVVECGMGGLADSTNAIDTPEIAVITSVSIDHTNFLGTSLAEIAFQKSGIIKPESKVVLYPNPACESVFEKKCIETNSLLIKVEDFGDFKRNNLETAKVCLSLLGYKSEILYPRLPARQEMINDKIMIDGAHNIGGALSLEKNLPDKNITAVIGMMKDKDVKNYLQIIAPHCKKIIAVTPENRRSLSAEELAVFAKPYCSDISVCNNSHKAILSALSSEN